MLSRIDCSFLFLLSLKILGSSSISRKLLALSLSSLYLARQSRLLLFRDLLPSFSLSFPRDALHYSFAAIFLFRQHSSAISNPRFSTAATPATPGATFVAG